MHRLYECWCGGENYDGARPCNFDWVKHLREECEKCNVTFCFIETGTVFIKDSKTYLMPKKQLQSKMAYKSKMNLSENRSNGNFAITSVTKSRKISSMCH